MCLVRVASLTVMPQSLYFLVPSNSSEITSFFFCHLHLPTRLFWKAVHSLASSVLEGNCGATLQDKQCYILFYLRLSPLPHQQRALPWGKTLSCCVGKFSHTLDIPLTIAYIRFWSPWCHSARGIISPPRHSGKKFLTLLTPPLTIAYARLWSLGVSFCPGTQFFPPTLPHQLHSPHSPSPGSGLSGALAVAKLSTFIMTQLFPPPSLLTSCQIWVLAFYLLFLRYILRCPEVQ